MAKVGIKEVAQEAGVSLSTVSIIINGKAEERKISQQTQEKVWNAVEKLQFRSNISAKNLKEGSNSDFVVALFWSFDFRRTMASRFLAGLQAQKLKSREDFQIVIYPYKSGELYKEKEAFIRKKFHAAIIANTAREDMEFLETMNFPMPIVIYNRHSQKYSSTNIDDARIGKIAADHLYERGFRKPFLITAEYNFPGMSLRNISFCNCMRDKGIQIKENDFIVGENSSHGGAACGEALIARMKEGTEVDCIFCASDALARGTAYSFIKNGYRIPEDIGILAIGNGDSELSEFFIPSISVINIPMEQMSAMCYELVEKGMYRQDIGVEHIFFDTELISRRSTDATES